MAWWRPVGALDRFLADLLCAEAQALRPGGPVPPPVAFRPAAVLGDRGLGFDSLERLALAAALGEALFLHRGGLDEALVVGERLELWRDAAMAALDRVATEVAFRSSGSTSARRRCVHALAALDEEILVHAAMLTDRRRLLAAVPCHHIYGFLFTLMLPARLGVAVTDVRERFPGAVVAMLRPGDLVIGHPGFWGELCRAAPEGWPPDVVGISSGAPCPAETAAATAHAGLSRLLQIYGSSETAGIGWRDDPAAPYRLLPFWRAVEGGLQRGDTPPIAPPDRLHWLDADRFVLEGRHDAAVQVGGVNVSPGHVRDVLLDHPEVADAAVRLMAPHEGSRLKAFVVPRDVAREHALLRELLSRHADLRLDAPERPRAFSFGAALPVTAAGKPADWPLPAG